MCCVGWLPQCASRSCAALHIRRRAQRQRHRGTPQAAAVHGLLQPPDPGRGRPDQHRRRRRRARATQKICRAAFDEILVMFKEDVAVTRPDIIEVAMPVGLYTSCEVSAPCGFCSAGGYYRAARRPRYVPRSRSHAGRSRMVHARLRRVSIPQQCKAQPSIHQRASSSRWKSRRKFRGPRRNGRATSLCGSIIKRSAH